MGAVVSCVSASIRSLSPPFNINSNAPQIEGVFRAIGSILMAIVNGIGAILTGIINGIVAFFDVIISCLTCGRGGGRRRGRGTTSHV